MGIDQAGDYQPAPELNNAYGGTRLDRRREAFDRAAFADQNVERRRLCGIVPGNATAP